MIAFDGDKAVGFAYGAPSADSPLFAVMLAELPLPS